MVQQTIRSVFSLKHIGTAKRLLVFLLHKETLEHAELTNKNTAHQLIHFGVGDIMNLEGTHPYRLGA